MAASSISRRGVLAGALALASSRVSATTGMPELRIDYATYNPLSLVIRSRGLLEQAFAPEKTTIRWVLSQGSNKALEFLNAGSIDIGSTAGAAALIGRLNGNPIRSVGTFSKPEWTALVTTGAGPFAGPADLKGKRIAVTRGTDPHIFLVRALETAGLGEHDVKLVLLQHPDGRTALLRGDVDAWAGLDPLMAQAEIESAARLFYRNPGFNSFGILNAREDFARTSPDAVRRVLSVYEEARRWALANPADFRAILAKETRLSDVVVARQLERTDLSSTALGTPQRDVILAAGLALQKVGVVPASAEVGATVDALLDTSFSPGTADVALPIGRRSREGADRAPSAAARALSVAKAGRGPAASIAIGVLVPALVLLAYEGAFRAGLVEARVLPPPSRVAGTLWTLACTGELLTHVVATVWRVASGFVLGSACGLVLGGATGSSTWARRLLDPTVQALRSVPSLAWVPLFILWLGIFEPSKIALIATGVFFPVYLGSMAALRRVDRKLIEVGRAYDLSRAAMVRRICAPAILPEVVTALRSGLGLGFMFVVAAEIMGASEGLGYLLIDGQQLGKPDQILAAIVSFAVVGKALDSLVLLASRPFLRWQDAV